MQTYVWNLSLDSYVTPDGSPQSVTSATGDLVPTARGMAKLMKKAVKQINK
jgi:hypothetical protein